MGGRNRAWGAYCECNSPVGSVCDGEDVRRHLEPLLPLVQLDDLLCVDGEALVRVDHHAKQAGVSLEGMRYVHKED